MNCLSFVNDVGCTIYINIEQILMFYYLAIDDKTYIQMKNDNYCRINGNRTIEISKIITAATTGAICKLG